MIKPPKKLVIKSNTSELKKVEDFIMETLEFYKLPLKGYSKIFLCVSEAVVNSIEHGNKFDKNKNVFIEAQYIEEKLNFIIKDEGDGFEMDKIDNPTLKKNIKKETGRGIHIIKSYCDKIEVRKNESLIRFKIDYQ